MIGRGRARTASQSRGSGRTGGPITLQPLVDRQFYTMHSRCWLLKSLLGQLMLCQWLAASRFDRPREGVRPEDMSPEDFVRFLLALDTAPPAERLARTRNPEASPATLGLSAREWADRIIQVPSGAVYGQEALSTAAKDEHIMRVLQGRAGNEEIRDERASDRRRSRESGTERRPRADDRASRSAEVGRTGAPSTDREIPVVTGRRSIAETTPPRPTRSILRQPTRPGRRTEAPKRVTFRFQREPASVPREDSGL